MWRSCEAPRTSWGFALVSDRIFKSPVNPAIKPVGLVASSPDSMRHRYPPQNRTGYLPLNRTTHLFQTPKHATHCSSRAKGIS